jgi:hypothetical protein
MWVRSFYIKQLVDDAEKSFMVTVYESPGVKNRYSVMKDSERLPKDHRAWYHSVVAKLLYLAKRAQQDVLAIVIFLCTRVQGAMVARNC